MGQHCEEDFLEEVADEKALKTRRDRMSSAPMITASQPWEQRKHV